MEPYAYKALDLNEPMFRLVQLIGCGTGQKLQCRIINAFLGSKFLIDYEAVSYTWGAQSNSSFFIEVLENDTVTLLRISYNLYHLLLDLRNAVQDRILWIDAICINQGANDSRERNHQVQQMDQIYNQAQSVVVWLGQSTFATSLAMEWLINLQTSFKHKKCNTNDLQVLDACKHLRSNQICLGVEEIFARPWFQRVWILQEVGNARTATIQIGKLGVSSAIFSLASSLAGVNISSHCQAILDLMPGSPNRAKRNGVHKDLKTLLREFRQAQATREHDRIYALFGLCSEEDRGLKVFYEKPIEEAIFEVASHLCRYELLRSDTPLHFSLSDLLEHLDDLEDQLFSRIIKSGDISSVQFIIKQHSQFITVTETAIVAAIQMHDHGIQIIELMIEEIGELPITERVVAAALYSLDLSFIEMRRHTTTKGSSFETSEMLDRRHSRYHDIYNAHREKIFSLILNMAKEAVITEKIVLHFIEMEKNHLKLRRELEMRHGMEFCRSNAENGRIEFAKSFFEKIDSSIFTEETLAAAIKTVGSPPAFCTLFRRADASVITERILLAGVRSVALGPEVLSIILQRADNSAITETLIAAVLDTWVHLPFTESFLLAALGNSSLPLEYLSLCFERADESAITEAVVSAALKSLEYIERKATEHLDIIFSRVDISRITDEMAITVVENIFVGEDALSYFLRRFNKPAIITEEVILNEIHVNEYYWERLCVMVTYASDSAITEKVAMAAVKRGYRVKKGRQNGNVMRCIVERGGPSVITEAVTAAICSDLTHCIYAAEYVLKICEQPVKLTRVMIRNISYSNLRLRFGDPGGTRSSPELEAMLLQFLIDSGLQTRFIGSFAENSHQALRTAFGNDIEFQDGVAGLLKAAGNNKKRPRLDITGKDGAGSRKLGLDDLLKSKVDFVVDCPSGFHKSWSYWFDTLPGPWHR